MLRNVKTADVLGHVQLWQDSWRLPLRLHHRTDNPLQV